MPRIPRPYPIDTTPDGQGAWFQLTASRFQKLAEELKERKKRPFDWAQALLAAGWMKRCRLPLVLVDTGGRLDAKLAVICRYATHAILVAREGADCEEWRQFIQGMDWDLLAVVWSSQSDGADSPGPIPGTKPPQLVVHGLERGRDISASPAVGWICKNIARRIRRRQGKKPGPAVASPAGVGMDK